MASFQKRGKTWQYTVSNKGNTPLRKGGFATKKAAQVAAAEVEANLSKGVIMNSQPLPFDEYFEEWYKLYKKNVTKSTLEHYKYTLAAIRSYFGSKYIQDIKRRDYQEFLNVYGSTRARETVEKVHTHIRSCVLDAVEENIIRIDFTRKSVLTGSVPAKKPSEKHLHFEESEKLLKEIYKRLDLGLGYYILLLGLTSGMRFGEMVGLTRKDFDFDNQLINIEKTWGYLPKMCDGFGPTKNEQSVRVIKMDKKTMDTFEKLFETTPTNLHRLVFFSAQSKYKVISNGNANKLLRGLLKDLGIIDTITVHGLRHTHASVLLYKKTSIYYIAERLGHKDIQTTLKDYSHLIKELREEDEQTTINTFKNMVV